MDYMFTLIGDTFTKFTDLSVYFIEMNLNLKSISEQKRLYDLFVHLVNRGHEKAASDLWDNMIRQNFIVKPI
jgi:hypothetical protein